MRIGIIVAMEKEFVQLKTLLEDQRAEKHNSRHYILGMINENELVMMQSGIGKMARRNKALIDEVSATIILQGWMERKQI